MDPNVDNLKSKTQKGLIWSAIDRFSSQGIQFVFGILIARILTPEDYGVIAMPLFFLALAQVFIDSGFSNALIRKQDLKDCDLSTAFIFNIGVGVVCYFVLFFTSPLIADFYNTPILSDLLKVTALATLFNPLCAVQQAILTKRIDFKSQSIVSVSAAVVSGSVGLYLAFVGYGVWALVFQQVSASLIRIILLWFIAKWKPSLVWSKESFNYLWGFGSKIMAVGVLDTVFNNIYPLVIGKFYTANNLGNYTRAQQFVDLPVANITGILQRVTLPVLSSIQNDEQRLTNNYLRLLRGTAFFMFPLLIGLAVLAYPLLYCFLGEKWLGCVIFIQLLCFAKLFTPINAVNLNLLQVLGRSDLFLKLELIKKAVIVVVMIITIPRGIIWMVSGTIFTTFVAFIINTICTKKLIGVGLFYQLKEFLPIILNTLLMGGFIYLVYYMFESPLLQFVIGFIIGVIVYFLTAKLFKLTALDDMNFFLHRN